MKTTKKFINAVKEDIANSNVKYSSLWDVAEKRTYVGKRTSKRYAALVYLYERADSEPVFRIYYNFEASMGDRVDYTIRNTTEEANEEFAKTLIP